VEACISLLSIVVHHMTTHSSSFFCSCTPISSNVFGPFPGGFAVAVTGVGFGVGAGAGRVGTGVGGGCCATGGGG